MYLSRWRLRQDLGFHLNIGIRISSKILIFTPACIISFRAEAETSDTQRREGDDGSWSSFALRVGSSQKVVRVLPSTAALETWVVSPLGCPFGRPGTSNSTTCSESRGGLFDFEQSTTWKPLGNFSLDLELNLGYNEIASLGLDTLALGFDDSNVGLRIDTQVIFAIATDDYYLGLFGLGHLGTNVSNFSHPYSSFLTALKSNNFIPSLSWAYTAGGPYRTNIIFHSHLT